MLFKDCQQLKFSRFKGTDHFENQAQINFEFYISKIFSKDWCFSQKLSTYIISRKWLHFVNCICLNKCFLYFPADRFFQSSKKSVQHTPSKISLRPKAFMFLAFKTKACSLNVGDFTEKNYFGLFWILHFSIDQEHLEWFDFWKNEL